MLLQRPVGLDESGVPRRCETRVGIAKRLPVFVRLPVYERIEGRESVNRSKAVVSRRVLSNPINVCAKTDQPPSLLNRSHVAQFVVVLTPSAIPVIRTPKIDKTCNNDLWPNLIASSQYRSSSACLKTKAIECLCAENRSQGAGDSLIFDETASSAAGINQPAVVEGVSNFAVVS